MNAYESQRIQWQDEVACHRFQLIAPLLDETLDDSKRMSLRKKIAEESGYSLRTIYRYEAAYRQGQFEGLRPAERKKQRVQNLPENFGTILDEAIQLRKEVPERSVAKIIYILELEGVITPGTVSRSTLQRQLYNAGFGSEHMRAYKDARESSSRRFCKPNRMMLVQCDIKYGPYLPIGKNGAPKRTYLSSVIDDHSRFLLHSQFYISQTADIVENSFHQAILKWGIFDEAYVDHGSQYIATQLKISLSRLGVQAKYAPIHSGKSKGKVEKFHQVVDAFMREVKLKKVKTLEELNRYWEIFSEEYYQNDSHKGIREYYESLGATLPAEGISPRTEFNRDSRPLKFLDVSVVNEAFLHHETRKVDKGACISFRGKKYETKPELIGHKVNITYDPAAPETITVSYLGYEPFTAKPLKIGSFCDKKPTLPVGMQDQIPSTSRFLDALERKHTESMKQQADALSFASYRKGADDNV